MDNLMNSIIDYMTKKHRDCDDAFAAAEQAVSTDDWGQANDHWRAFADELERHLQMEEQVLFPKLEETNPSSGGPTNMMRMEHQQMRSLVHQINEALSEQLDENFFGLSETLMVLMQQHNMKEEQVLYPMADQTLSAPEDVIAAMDKLH